MSRVTIVGASGYLGLSYAVALVHLGHRVIGIDLNAAAVERLNAGRSPIYEPRLDELLTEGLKSSRLSFVTEYASAVPDAEFILLCVGTPGLSDGQTDMRQVQSGAAQIGKHVAPGQHVIVVNKSTMPIGTGDHVAQLISEHAPDSAEVRVVSNPEFLREGSAIHDILSPDRIILGTDDRSAADAVAGLYAPLDAPIVYTDRRSAEMVKYAANAFLATKISFINEVAQICDRLGANVTTVAHGIGLDSRIGDKFLNAGLGFGGSCFPKDVSALARMADMSGLHPQMLRAVMEINRDIRRRFVVRLDQLLGGLDGRVIATWGLSFKEDTDDLRNSPALDIIRMLQERGATVRAFDPHAMDKAAPLLPAVIMCEHAHDSATGADAVALITPWAEFRGIDFARIAKLMRGDLIADGRNLWDPEEVRDAGLRYLGIGRAADESSVDEDSVATPVLAPIERSASHQQLVGARLRP